MDEGLVAAARWFAERQRALEPLAAADESFRLLCADLAAAEAALQRWRVSASAVRDQRCSEYEELVDSLVGEIASYLDAAKAGVSDAR